MPSNETKEVRFDKWCALCEHHEKPEHEDPCNDCLARGDNNNSTRPLYFKNKVGEEGRVPE